MDMSEILNNVGITVEDCGRHALLHLKGTTLSCSWIEVPIVITDCIVNSRLIYLKRTAVYNLSI